MSPAKETERDCCPPGQPPPPSPLTPKPRLDTMFRLPASPVPNNYHITVAFSISARSYRGSVVTSVSLLHPTNTICLNSQNLVLSNISLKSDSGLVVPGVVGEENAVIGVVRLDFGPVLVPAGSYDLSIDFCGTIRTGLQGVYLNRFTGEDGQEKEGICTMFAATEARSFFPCWDQPDIKCCFDLIVIVREGLQVLSNMEGRSTDLDTISDFILGNTREGWDCHTFDRSPKMSTYLLCLVVGQYASLSQEVAGTKVSVYSPLNRCTEGQFAVDIAVKCINIFNDFFGIPYCLPKLDLIGIACLSVGAMENWGLITFRENSLLVEDTTSSNVQLQAVATIVAHEISHQWFGNLVTMSWWSDLWLNEGFATFMQYYAIDQIFPQFQLWDQFCSDVLIPSLQLDALENSHPIKVDVHNPQEIDEIFDKISYRKGASVIRMLVSVMGGDAFVAGIRSYMQTYAYGNACTADLWASLSTISEVGDVADLMDCWVNNVGFPIIRVNLVKGREGCEVITITQERFSAAHKCNDGLLWRVPITASIQPAWRGDTVPDMISLPHVVMAERTIELSIPPGVSFDVSHGSFVKMNTGFVSYYRTDYSKDLGSLLEKAISNLRLPPVDRLSTLEDRVSLVLGEQGNTVALMGLIAQLHNEDSFLVWKNLSSFFHVLRCIVWSSEALAARFDCFVVGVMVPCLERIGWSKVAEESHLTSMLRGLLICQLGTRGCATVEEKCQSLFNSWIGEDGEGDVQCDIEPGLREVVMKVAMASCNSHQAFDSLLRLLDVPQERNRVLYSMGYSRNKDVLARVLAFSLNPRLRDQESVTVIESVCQNRIGIRLAWDFFKEHLKEFFNRYGHGLILMSKLIKCVTENFSTEEELTEVAEFFMSHPEIGCERTIKQAKENISLNLYWKNRDLDSVAKFLTDSH